jgi:hypothetical protein
LLFASWLLTTLIGAGLWFVDFKPGLPLSAFESGQVTVQSSDAAPAGMAVNSFAGTTSLIVIGVLLLIPIVQD